MSHTPGTWTARQIAKAEDQEYFDKSGSYRDAFLVEGPEEIGNHECGALNQDDAILMAASKELLEAAKRKLDDCRQVGECSEVLPEEYCSDECIALANAVSKAKARP